MKSKARKSNRGILQQWEMIPITDPDEQAALERRCREADKMLAKREARKSRPPKRKGKPRPSNGAGP